MKPQSVLLIAIAALLLATPSNAQERIMVGPFYYFSDHPEQLYLDGPIAANAVDTLQQLFETAPVEPNAIALNSDIGTLVSAFVLAELVRTGLMNTVVPEGAVCSGPCFFVFLAGIDRQVQGGLVFSNSIDASTLTYLTAPEVRDLQSDAIARFGAAASLGDLLADLAPNEDYAFAPDDLQSFGLVRSLTEGAAQVAVGQRPPLGAEPTVPPYQEIGEPVVGLLTLTDTNGNVAEVKQGSTRWYLSTDGNQPSVRARLDVAGPPLSVIVTLRPVPNGTTPDLSDVIVVEILLPDAEPFADIEQVGALGISTRLDERGRDVYFIQRQQSFATDSTQIHRFVLFVPTIYSGIVRRSFADGQNSVITLYFAFSDGREGLLVVPITDVAHEAITDVQAAWRDLARS